MLLQNVLFSFTTNSQTALNVKYRYQHAQKLLPTYKYYKTKHSEMNQRSKHSESKWRTCQTLIYIITKLGTIHV